MASLRQLMQRPVTTPGFAGGTLEEQLARALQTRGDVNAGQGQASGQQPQILTPQNQAAITRPRRTYNTTLSPDEETKFTEWKQQNAPNDTGQDYDLRGAFRAGLSPAANGHWADTFKKPNHPTFSNQSQYAVGSDAARAGHWDGDKFIPPTANQGTTEGKSPSSLRDMLVQSQTPQASAQAEPESLNTPFGATGEVFGSTRPRRTQMRDYIADDSAYLRDLENQPRNWKDKAVDVTRALNNNINGPGQISPPTRRERDITRATGTLGRDIAVEKEKTARELGSLVPVQLEDGTMVMSPARSAGTLTSQQQNIRRNNTTAQGHLARWKQMGKHEAVQDALRVYNSGGANDPSTLEAISETLDLPATLKPKFLAGEIMPQVDKAGQLQLVNKRDGSVVNTGVTSYETTKEAGRNARQERAATAAMARTEALIKAGVSKLGDPKVIEDTAAELEDQAQEAEDTAKSLTEQGFPSQGAKAADRAVKLRESANKLTVEASKAKTAQGGTPTKTGRTIEGAIKAFTRARNRPPTQDEIDKMKTALEK